VLAAIGRQAIDSQNENYNDPKPRKKGPKKNRGGRDVLFKEGTAAGLLFDN